MESPKPVPPSNLDCSGSNIFNFCLASNPMPVSRNAILSHSGVTSSLTVSLPPSGMARSAFSQRFQNTCENALRAMPDGGKQKRSEEHTSELQSHLNLVCRLLLE